MLREDQLSNALHIAAESVKPDQDALIAAALELGRDGRRRRARLAARSALAVAAAGIVAVGVAILPATAQHTASPVHTPAPAPTQSAQAASPARNRPPTPYPSEPTPPVLPHEDVLSLFKRLAPAGTGTLSYSPYVPPQLQTLQDTELHDDDGHGLALIRISVSSGSYGTGFACNKPQYGDEVARPSGALPVGCSLGTLPNGDAEITTVSPDDQSGWYGLTVQVDQRDGLLVQIEADNGYLAINPVSTATRARPPFTAAQLLHLADSTQWAAVLQPQTSTTPTASVTLDAAGALAVLQQLLPTGHVTLNPPDPGENALLEATYNDGHGASRVLVFVAPAANSGMDPIWCAPQLPPDGAQRPAGAPPQSCSTTTLADGDSAMLQVTATDTAGVYSYRIIDDRTDGIDVEIEITNAPSFKASPSRIAPPFTLSRWLTITDDKAWD